MYHSTFHDGFQYLYGVFPINNVAVSRYLQASAAPPLAFFHSTALLQWTEARISKKGVGDVAFYLMSFENLSNPCVSVCVLRNSFEKFSSCS